MRTGLRISTVVLALALVSLLPSRAQAQSWEDMLSMLETMSAEGVSSGVESGRTAALVAGGYGFYVGDPWVWDLDQPYQAFTCDEKERKLNDVGTLINDLN